MYGLTLYLQNVLCLLIWRFPTFVAGVIYVWMSWTNIPLSPTTLMARLTNWNLIQVAIKAEQKHCTSWWNQHNASCHHSYLFDLQSRKIRSRSLIVLSYCSQKSNNWSVWGNFSPTYLTKLNGTSFLVVKAPSVLLLAQHKQVLS